MESVSDGGFRAHHDSSILLGRGGTTPVLRGSYKVGREDVVWSSTTAANRNRIPLPQELLARGLFLQKLRAVFVLRGSQRTCRTTSVGGPAVAVPLLVKKEMMRGHDKNSLCINTLYLHKTDSHKNRLKRFSEDCDGPFGHPSSRTEELRPLAPRTVVHCHHGPWDRQHWERALSPRTTDAQFERPRPLSAVTSHTLPDCRASISCVDIQSRMRRFYCNKARMRRVQVLLLASTFLYYRSCHVETGPTRRPEQVFSLLSTHRPHGPWVKRGRATTVVLHAYHSPHSLLPRPCLSFMAG